MSLPFLYSTWIGMCSHPILKELVTECQRLPKLVLSLQCVVQVLFIPVFATHIGSYLSMFLLIIHGTA